MRWFHHVAAVSLITCAALPAFAQGGGRNRGNPNEPVPVPGARAGRPGVGLPGSQANIAAARSQLDDARAELDRLTLARQREFEKSPQLLGAQRAVEAALADVRSEKARVTKGLESDASYVAAKKLDEEAQAAAARAPAAQREPASAAAMRAANVVARLENTAFTNDTGVQNAQKRLVDAQRVLEKVKSDFQSSLLDDKEFKDLRAKIDRLDAQVKAWEERADTLEDRRGRRGR